MSWQTLNKMLGLALISPKFAHRLLDNPPLVVQEFGFDLTEEERSFLLTAKAGNIAELSQMVLEQFSNTKPSH